ncbi:MAG TPA: hypothetical protein VNT42_04705 [Sphingomonas sp.]|nr:hypothetical protein [Sphingomonas sp.]
MSLADFQRAMADLAASPALCRGVQADPAMALRPYMLSDREQARLKSVVWQAGMAVNCSIHRTTRLVPLDTLLPMTCAAFGAALGPELDAYWADAKRPAIRFDIEASRFVAHLETRLPQGGKGWPWPSDTLVDLARLELAIETLRVAPHVEPALKSTGPNAGYCRLDPSARVVALDHDPAALLAGARADPPQLGDIPRHTCLVVLTSDEGQLGVFSVPPERIDDVQALIEDAVAAPWLIEAGLAVNGAPQKVS